MRALYTYPVEIPTAPVHDFTIDMLPVVDFPCIQDTEPGFQICALVEVSRIEPDAFGLPVETFNLPTMRRFRAVVVGGPYPKGENLGVGRIYEHGENCGCSRKQPARKCPVARAYEVFDLGAS
jgi:hypothetical protein